MGRVCIVTEELVGLTPSGGIGACARGLALHLASAGHLVDVLITNLSLNSEHFADPNLASIDLHSLVDFAGSDKAIELPVDDITKSFCVYRFLRDRNYDIVHFND